MNHSHNIVYYLVLKKSRRGKSFELCFPSELIESDTILSQGTGVFIFPRHTKNRGKLRYLHFKAQAGVEANEIVVKLKALPRSSIFVCVQEAGYEFLSDIKFSARKLPTDLRFSGKAAVLAEDFNPWCLIPKDPALLEENFFEHRFFFFGEGGIVVDP